VVDLELFSFSFWCVFLLFFAPLILLLPQSVMILFFAPLLFFVFAPPFTPNVRGKTISLPRQLAG
jgi:hypothetical protein